MNNNELLLRAGSIPIEDPQEAIQFCKSFARFLEAQSSNLPAANGNALAPQTEHPPEVSVIIPVFNEEENLETLYSRLLEVLTEERCSFELLFVNDGSSDRSIELLQRICNDDIRTSVIDLARNFGHQTALSAGLDFARGEAVVLMDADLQDTPETLPRFIKKWRAGYEVVYAIRTERKEHWAKQTGYRLFYRLMRSIAKVDIPLDAGDFCIMDRRVVDLVVRMPERNRFIRGIRSWVGFNQIGIEVERQARNAGDAKYSYSDLVFLALDGLVSFSFVPLRIISVAGMGVSVFSIILAIFYTVKKIFYGLYPPGFATLVVAISFFAGVQLITVGVIGEYVGRIFEEVKRRPLYVVQRLLGSRFE